MKKNVLNLINLGDGNRIKQGDRSKMTFQLSDGNADNLNLEGSAKIYMKKRDYLYKYETQINDNTVDLRITDVIPVGTYTVEVVANGYVFPSDNAVKIDVTPSVLGKTLEVVKSTNFFSEAVVESMVNNYAENMGELDVILIEWHDGYTQWPLVFSKKECNEADYDNWKKEKKAVMQSVIAQNTPTSPEEVYDITKSIFQRLTFPLALTIHEEYGDNIQYYFEDNLKIPRGLIPNPVIGIITAQYMYNGEAIEQNAITTKYTDENSAE